MRNFLTDRGGNVAMMFAILVIPLIVAVGVAIDILRTNQVKTELAEAADAGVLAAARAKLRDDTLTDEQAKAIALKAFNANRKTRAQLDLTSFEFRADDVNDIFSLRVVGDLDTAIMGIVGRDKTPVDVFTEAKIAPPRVLEAILVLDNTASMAGTKLDALKTASNDLIDIIMKDRNNTVKVGVVPFSNHVNVGLSRRHVPWISVPPDYTDPNVCYDTFPNPDPSTCTTTNATCDRDGVPSSCTQTTCTDNGPAVEVCADEVHTWHGCVGSRNAPLNVEDRDYLGTTKVPGLLNAQCTEEILPLTTTKTSVISKINSMAANGQTYLAPGLLWGYRLISNQAPFTEGVTYQEIIDDGGSKIIILMTDGANTRSARIPASPRHNGSDSVAADATLIDTCDEVKSDDIILYTIAFDVSDANIKTKLENCATSPDHYYDARNTATLKTTFQDIANQLVELALTK